MNTFLDFFVPFQLEEIIFTYLKASFLNASMANSTPSRNPLAVTGVGISSNGLTPCALSSKPTMSSTAMDATPETLRDDVVCFWQVCVSDSVSTVKEKVRNSLWNGITLYFWRTNAEIQKILRRDVKFSWKQYYTISWQFKLLNVIVNAIGDVNKHLYCWKYTMKWLETPLFWSNVQFWPFLENTTSGVTKRCADLNLVLAILYTIRCITTKNQ